MLQGLKWAALGIWTLNHPQVVGICPDNCPQLIAQSRYPNVLGLTPPRGLKKSIPWILLKREAYLGSEKTVPKHLGPNQDVTSVNECTHDIGPLEKEKRWSIKFGILYT